jgi:KDO2-lipid IV(A) lauroyltransferase
MRASAAETVPAAGQRSRRPWNIPVPGALRAAEAIAFWLVTAPFLALLPSGIGYRAACWRGDWTFRSDPGKRDQITSNLRLVLGEELGEQEAERMTREVFRQRSCWMIDLMRMRRKGRALGKLVEIRGREHLDAALAGGKGAILCSAHQGSFHSAFSLIHASGYPVTSIGRWWWEFPPGETSAVERLMWELVYGRRVDRHRHRPNITPWPGRWQVAVQAANVLRANEVVTICCDSPPQAEEQSRAVEVPFLGGKARFVPGIVMLAQASGAPVLMISIRRLPDYRHQVVEISPPMTMDGDTTVAFQRCMAALEAAIRANPAEWDTWHVPEDLVRMGLVPDAPHQAAMAGDRTDRETELQQSSR